MADLLPEQTAPASRAFLAEQHAELISRLHAIHEETKREATAQHAQTLRLARWALGVAVLTLIAAGIAAFASVAVWKWP